MSVINKTTKSIKDFHELMNAIEERFEIKVDVMPMAQS